ncbi:MAG: hypothetical protein IJ641_08365 [Lachnospiraceae bacterium]|nr:hypothetical protein [Lachnospiraceae bacterium]
MEVIRLHREKGAEAMFGSKKNKEYDIRLTEKQVKELTKTMSRGERKEFEKRQRQAVGYNDYERVVHG